MGNKQDTSWRILVVDDEEDIHAITKIALRNKQWHGRPFELVSAFSAKEAIELLKNESENFHVAIVDVVMETETAGLQLCEHIRADASPAMRIVLRTGQPGMAPEDSIMETYDIDYYLEKSESTQKKLYSVIRACLRTSEDMVKLEDANVALTVKNAELARLDQFRQAVLNNIGDPDVGYISEVLHHAQTIADVTNLPLYLKRSAVALRDAAKRIRDVFRPYDFYTRAELVLQTRAILVVLENEQTRRLTLRALVGTSAQVTSVDNPEAALEILRQGQVDLLYFDWPNVRLINEALRYNPEVLGVLVVTEEQFTALGREIMNVPISSVVVSQAADDPNLMDALTLNELVVTAGKLLSGDIFGLEKYLAWGTAIREERITASRDRSRVVGRVGEYAARCQLSPRTRRQVETICDELLLNAIFDAPVTALSQPKYASRSRSENIELSAEEMVTLRFGSDGTRFGVSVTDNFGRLERDLAVSYILKCLEGPTADNSGASMSHGGGLGLYYAFMAVSTFIINVRAGQRTEVIGLINLRSGSGQGESRKRSFHYFLRLPR